MQVDQVFAHLNTCALRFCTFKETYICFSNGNTLSLHPVNTFTLLHSLAYLRTFVLAYLRTHALAQVLAQLRTCASICNEILASYNGIIDRYSAIMNRYNAIVYRYNEIIYRYNEILDRYNGIVDMQISEYYISYLVAVNR